jgi:catechol 2,3-dioxygenase-like lactoylglutathione lyase family enzyme
MHQIAQLKRRASALGRSSHDMLYIGHEKQDVEGAHRASLSAMLLARDHTQHAWRQRHQGIHSYELLSLMRGSSESEGVRMTLYVGSTVLNVADLHRATAFWTAALGYVVRDASPTFVVLTDPRRRWSNVSLQRSDAPKDGRNRLHLDLYTTNQRAEVARLESLGATRLPWTYPPDADYIVLADPDGNEFCVIDSPYSQEEAGSGHGKDESTHKG